MAKWPATMMMMMMGFINIYSDNDGVDDGVNVNKNEVIYSSSGKVAGHNDDDDDGLNFHCDDEGVDDDGENVED